VPIKFKPRHVRVSASPAPSEPRVPTARPEFEALKNSIGRTVTLGIDEHGRPGEVTGRVVQVTANWVTLEGTDRIDPALFRLFEDSGFGARETLDFHRSYGLDLVVSVKPH
jgi:hypothetical protein